MQLRKHWLKVLRPGIHTPTQSRVTIKTRSAEHTFVYISLANLQEGWFYSTTGQGCICLFTICEHFWLLCDLLLLRRVWHHDLYSCPFQVIDCTGSTPSTSSHRTETPTIFLGLQWISPVAKQPSWSGKDPKHNTVVQVALIWRGTPASFGHTAPAGAQGTLPGHWRWWAMYSCAACAGPQ